MDLLEQEDLQRFNNTVISDKGAPRMALGAPNSVQQGTMHACCTMHAHDLCLSNVSGKYACKKE